MQQDVFWLALAFMFMFEGLMPMLLPARWRETFLRLTRMTDQQIRLFGFMSVVAGLLLCWWVS